MMMQLMMVVLAQCCILCCCSSSMSRIVQQQGFSGMMTIIGFGSEGFDQISKTQIKKSLKHKTRKMPSPVLTF